MRVAFYYENWDDNLINGTQDSVDSLVKVLSETYDCECNIYNKFTDNHRLELYDVIIFLSSASGIDLEAIDTKTILWNHCWDYVEGVDQYVDTFDKVLALSPKHASHLGINDWCYNGIDLDVFQSQSSVPRDSHRIVFCGGPAWYKGGLLVSDVQKLLENTMYRLVSVWDIPKNLLADEFRRSQYVLIPSEIESFSLVSVQAQACGCIPIAHNCGGISETFPPEYYHALYSPNTVDQILATILTLPWNDYPYNKEVLVNNANRFDINKTAEKFYRILCDD